MQGEYSRCIFLDLPREILVLTTYIAYAGWLSVEKEVLLYLLKYHANEAKDNIPDIAQEYLIHVK